MSPAAATLADPPRVPVSDLRINWTAAEADRRADYAGRVMTRNGLPVSHDEAWKLYQRLDGIVQENLAVIRDTVPDFVPTPSGKYDLVYRVLGLQPDQELPDAVAFTESGGFSTDHRALCGIVRHLPAGSQRRLLLQKVIITSKAATTRNAAKAFLSPAQLALLEGQGIKVPGPDDYHVVDGWIHPRFAPTTLNGRYAASKPNIHGFNSAIKTIFQHEDYRFVQADADQIHIRIQGNEWRIPRLLDVLLSGADPHLAAMRALLGADVVTALQGFISWMDKPPGGSAADVCRQQGKVINYTGAYGGGGATLLAAALKDVDSEGFPLMSTASLGLFKDLLRRRKTAEPEWAAHYARVRAEWKQNGYLTSPGTGRRFLCKGGKVTDLYNCTVLGFEADLMGAMTFEAAQKWPHALRNQSHDSLVLMVPKDEAPEALHQLELLMNRQYVAPRGQRSHPVPYTASGAISRSLNEKV